jgi:hypothetical protein
MDVVAGLREIGGTGAEEHPELQLVHDSPSLLVATAFV